MSGDRLATTEVWFMDAEGTEHRTSIVEVDEARLKQAVPIRRIASHRGQRNRPGLFWSATTGGHVPYESWLELDRLWLADAAPEVTWIAAQPMWLRGIAGDKQCKHVPDLLLSLRGRPPLVVDVKPEQFAQQPDVKVVFDWTRRVCETRGWSYEVWTGAAPEVLAQARSAGWARRVGHPSLPPLAATNAPTCDSLISAWRAGGRLSDPPQEVVRGHV